MSTIKQIEANRANAKKSTGPRTLEGKSRSSMNALKSGIDAKSQIVRGEKASQLNELRDEYYAHFCPTAPDQRMLVDAMIDSEWLLRRLRRVEAELWEYGSRNRLRPEEDVALGQSYDSKWEIFDRLQRRVNSALRTYHAALKELRRLQAESEPVMPLPDPPPAESAAASTPLNQSLEPEIGFVPPIALTPSQPAAEPPLPDLFL